MILICWKKLRINRREGLCPSQSHPEPSANTLQCCDSSPTVSAIRAAPNCGVAAEWRAPRSVHSRRNKWDCLLLSGFF